MAEEMLSRGEGLTSSLDEHLETIVVLDFGGQYAHLIARRLRQMGVFSRIADPELFRPEDEPGLVGLVFSGGPRSVSSNHRFELKFKLEEVRVPLLGLCYGHQFIAQTLGGEVSPGDRREYGMTSLECDPGSVLMAGLPQRQAVWMSHGDHVTKVPPGFRRTAWSPTIPVAGYESPDGRILGLQFHPEVSHTEYGAQILEKFVRMCTARATWNPGSIRERLVERVRVEAGDRPLFLLISGGVDSLVTLALCIEAVGNQRVTSLHVDTGFMRWNESDAVMEFLRGLGFNKLHINRAGERFFKALEGVVEPETKRKIIGRLFVEELSHSLQEIELDEGWMLVQGTIYPDTIESGGTRNAATIKTHHNRVEEIEKMIQAGRVIEPLSELYKDEVRELGRELGLPGELVDRQPFPGPGLAIRILAHDGSMPPEGYLDEEEQFKSICASYGISGAILPVRSVGVQGDERTYAHPAAIWVEGPLDWDKVLTAATTVVNTLRTVNRVVLSPVDLDKAPLRLEAHYLMASSVEQLQRVDHLCREATAHLGEIWQMPVVSLPLLDSQGKRAFVLRPICSRDAMTASVYRMEPNLLQEMSSKVLDVPGVGPLLYDLTTKPPATIEWE